MTTAIITILAQIAAWITLGGIVLLIFAGFVKVANFIFGRWPIACMMFGHKLETDPHLPMQTCRRSKCNYWRGVPSVGGIDRSPSPYWTNKGAESEPIELVIDSRPAPRGPSNDNDDNWQPIGAVAAAVVAKADPSNSRCRHCGEDRYACPRPSDCLLTN